jgi:hypothetical protein
MTPAPAGEEPERGRGQPVVPPLDGRVLVVVFNQLRGIGPNPDAKGAPRRPTSFAEPWRAGDVNA